MREGKADYVFLIDSKALDIIEAKHVGRLLSGVAKQSDEHAESLTECFRSLL
jgi:type I site-specific restriction endonuclease